MKTVVIDRSQARKIILHAAGLAKPAQFGRGREAVLKLIDHLGYVQLDTNYTVERAHHHTIFARVPDYQPAWLWDLLEDARVFEYLTSDSGFIPMEDYRYSLIAKKSFEERYGEATSAELNAMNRVMDRIEREGPLMLKDFENDRTEASSGWWDWRPAKVALERLYFSGKLMVMRDKTFHKVYDLPNNIVPREINRTVPTEEEFARFSIKRFLGGLGLAYANELAWRVRFAKNNLVRKLLDTMVQEGEICEVEVQDLKTKPLYMLPAYRTKKLAASDAVYILSPFDPLNVFRKRLGDFFDFDYQVECFVPASKRKYGYFSLPVLSGERFIARMDSKADRKTRILTVHNLHFEKPEVGNKELLAFADSLRKFADFNQCYEIKITKCNKRDYLKTIREQLH